MIPHPRATLDCCGALVGILRRVFASLGEGKVGLAKYIAAIRDLTAELRDSIAEGERDELVALLRDLDLNRWETWKDDHRGLISRYVMSTPSERAKSIAFRSDRLLLVFAAYQNTLGAQAFLQVVESNQIYPGGAYRQMAGMAGLAYLEVFERAEPDTWPWGDDHPLLPRTPDGS